MLVRIKMRFVPPLRKSFRLPTVFAVCGRRQQQQFSGKHQRKKRYIKFLCNRFLTGITNLSRRTKLCVL